MPPLAALEDDADPVAAARRLVPHATGLAIAGAAIRHNITHRRIDVLPVRLEGDGFDPPSDTWIWVDPRDPGVPTSSLFKKLVAAVSC